MTVLAIKVALKLLRTITLFRNGSDDFRTAQERRAYGPYMQFPVFRGRAGGGLALAVPNFKPLYLRIGYRQGYSRAGTRANGVSVNVFFCAERRSLKHLSYQRERWY